MSRSHRSIAILALLFILGACFVGGSFVTADRGHTTSSTKTGFEIDPPSATVIHGSQGTVTISFRLINHGPQDVEIAGVKTSCGCTVADPIALTKLSPGETETLNVQVSPPAYGTNNVTVRVEYKSETQGVTAIAIPISLQGRPLEVPYVFDVPKELAIRGFSAEEAHRDFQIHTRESGSEPIWLQSLDCEQANVRATIVDNKFVQTLGHGEVHRVYNCQLVSFIPAQLGSSFSTEIRLRGNGPATRPVAPIRVSCARSTRIHASPQQVSLMVDSHTRFPQTRELTLLWNDSDEQPKWERFKIGSLPDCADTDFKEAPAVYSRIISLTLRQEPTSNFTITLSSDDSSETELVIPVIVNHQSRRTVSPLP